MLRDFGRNAVIRWIAHNQAFLDCPVERVVQHRVDAADRGITQPRLLALLRFAEPSVFLQVFVEPLQIAPSQLFQRNIPDARDNV